jgi:hypothetical protein
VHITITYTERIDHKLQTLGWTQLPRSRYSRSQESPGCREPTKITGLGSHPYTLPWTIAARATTIYYTITLNLYHKLQYSGKTRLPGISYKLKKLHGHRGPAKTDFQSTHCYTKHATVLREHTDATSLANHATARGQRDSHARREQ